MNNELISKLRNITSQVVPTWTGFEKMPLKPSTPGELRNMPLPKGYTPEYRKMPYKKYPQQAQGDFEAIFKRLTKGDNILNIIKNSNLQSNSGLWGENGDVAYYAKQLLDQNAIDTNGNVIKDTLVQLIPRAKERVSVIEDYVGVNQDQSNGIDAANPGLTVKEDPRAITGNEASASKQDILNALKVDNSNFVNMLREALSKKSKGQD